MIRMFHSIRILIYLGYQVKCDIIDKMFEAAERNGMNIILGLYPGDYSKTNTADPTKYNTNLERNKMLFDEVYEQFGNNPCLVGGTLRGVS